MSLKEIYDVAVPENKRKEEHYNYWLSIALRPASILVTAPFVGTKVKPITITKISIISLLLGFGLLSFGMFMCLKIIGWIFFFIWGVLDCVDGNVARCNNMCSPLGGLWDAVGGYTALVTIHFSAGMSDGNFGLQKWLVAYKFPDNQVGVYVTNEYRTYAEQICKLLETFDNYGVARISPIAYYYSLNFMESSDRTRKRNNQSEDWLTEALVLYKNYADGICAVGFDLDDKCLEEFNTQGIVN